MKRKHRLEEEQKSGLHQAEEARLENEILSLNEKLESINIPVTFLPLSPAASVTSDNQRYVKYLGNCLTVVCLQKPRSFQF